EILREKGTDRSRFFRGEVDRYTWCDVGSSYVPGELTAAFLMPQLEDARRITDERLRLWAHYHATLAPLEQAGRLRRPVLPPAVRHNAHMYQVLLPRAAQRPAVIRRMRELGASPVFHYVPLHSSPAGRRFGRAHGELPVTDDVAERLLRLPLWVGIDAPTVMHCFTAALADAERGA
ncbi:MAG TPA: DegT/DnrJ/EryC1/StrS family aminotransferase, partial [Methylibium sp.]|nr:DegT/DnrJ/EryC1/StrS family aminotransferase [Methylibium sp.]